MTPQMRCPSENPSLLAVWCERQVDHRTELFLPLLKDSDIIIHMVMSLHCNGMKPGSIGMASGTVLSLLFFLEL